MNKIKQTPVSIDRGQLQTIEFKASENLSLECNEGTAWITMPGDVNDYVLKAGERITVSARRGSLIVESLSNHLELHVRCA
jgi:Protein of unknown function (DUF2917)